MSDIQPKQQLKYSFILGFLFHSFITMMIQDIHGKAKYIQLVRDSWMDTSWIMWALFAGIVFYLYERLQNRIK